MKPFDIRIKKGMIVEEYSNETGELHKTFQLLDYVNKKLVFYDHMDQKTINIDVGDLIEFILEDDGLEYRHEFIYDNCEYFDKELFKL